MRNDIPFEEVPGGAPSAAAAHGVRLLRANGSKPAAHDSHSIETDFQQEPTAPRGKARTDALSAPDIVCAAAFAGKPIPIREWSVDQIVPARNVTLFTGDGGGGKSLVIQQLLSCAAVGKPWLGRDVKPATALYVSAEDEEAELHRRLDAIAQHMDVPIPRFERLHFWSLVGTDPLLAVPDRMGVMRPTALWDELLRHVRELGAGLVALDPLVALFGGNEIVRTHARQFLNLLRRLAIDIDGSVILCAHPSLSGSNAGTGGSGSTDWVNGVRSRVFMERVEEDEDARVLRVNKLNYGRVGTEIAVRWRNGVFVPDPDTSASNGTEKRSQRPPSTSGAGKALIELEHLVMAGQGVRSQGHERVPDGAILIKKNDWRAACFAKGLTATREAEAEKKAFSRAVENLEKTLIGSFGDEVWILRGTPTSFHENSRKINWMTSQTDIGDIYPVQRDMSPPGHKGQGRGQGGSPFRGNPVTVPSPCPSASASLETEEFPPPVDECVSGASEAPNTSSPIAASTDATIASMEAEECG